MLTKILLWFGVVSNVATLIGLLIAYMAAPVTVQNRVGHILLVGGAGCSVVLYLLIAAFVLRSRNSTKQEPDKRDAQIYETFNQLLAHQKAQAETLDRLADAVAWTAPGITCAGAVTLPRLAVKATGTVSTLGERAATLARDLLKFLKEKGPIPEQPPIRAPESGSAKVWEETWKYFSDVKLPLEQKIDAGYSRRFATLVSNMRHEIQEQGTNTFRLDELVEKRYHDSETIREIAAMLLEISVRMRTDDLLNDATG